MSAFDDIGPYAITGVLGKGGMGVVYAGTHRTTGLRAAVKTVNAIKAEKISQIRREIETLARLRHPGVVRIVDFSTAGELPWYAMDLLQGLTLEEMCTKFWSGPAAHVTEEDVTFAGDDLVETRTTSAFRVAANRIPTPATPPSLPPAARRPRAANGRLPEALGLVQRLCETLAYVHGEGVVHRDLKPSNIFVTHDHLPVLVDFGLVAIVGGATGREVLDETRAAGSVKYMAPEQIEGELLDPRTDLYALGCIVYELLTGQAPFVGDIARVVDQHRFAMPQPAGELVSGVPDELEQLVTRMLAKDPLDRLAYASDLAACAAKYGAQAPRWPGEVPRGRVYLCRPPLVGRQSVLRDLDTTVRRLDQRKGGVVFISGESGVGKTRLALEVAWRTTARGGSVVTGGCMPVLRDAASGAHLQGAPLHPLTPFLRLIADRCAEAGLEKSERVVGDRGPVLAAYEPAFASLPGQAGRPAATPLRLVEARARLFRSLTDTIFEHVASEPTMLMLDDLHWADELTLDLLGHLARGQMREMPLLILGTFRLEEKNAALGALAGTDGVLNIELAKLSPASVGDMVAGMLAIRQPPREFVSFLSRKSEGNPFFVMEYLRMAVAEQVIVRTPAGEWMFSETTDPTEVLCESLPLPRSLREVINRRLDRLSPAARGAVNCATLIGREFDVALLQTALSVSDAEMAVIVAELEDRHVIEPAEAADTFRFAHDKLREIPYAELTAEERAGLHRQIATAIETRPDGDRREASLGHHWSAAGECARAIPHLHRAGDRAQMLHAVKDAVDLYRAALHDIARLPASGAPAMAAEAALLHEKLADALALTGAHESAQAEFERAITALGADHTADAARLYRKIGKTLETLHDHARALDAYARAADLLDSSTVLARDAAWRAEWIQVRLNRIWVYYWQARIREMDAELTGVAPHVEAHGLPLQRSSYYQAIVTRNYRQHRYVISDETVQYAKQSFAFAAEANARVEAAFARFILGFGLLFHDELDAAEAELYEALQETRRLGDVTSQVRCLAYLAIVSRRAGRVGHTRARAQETLTLAMALKMFDYVGVAHAALGWVAWREDHPEEAGRLCQAAFDAWAQLSFAYPFQWTAALTMLAAQGSRAPLRQLIATAEKLLDSHQMRLPDPINGALESAVAAYRREDAEEAREALGRAVSEAGRLGFV
jgi:serine/threonine protein kinase